MMFSRGRVEIAGGKVHVFLFGGLANENQSSIEVYFDKDAGAFGLDHASTLQKHLALLGDGAAGTGQNTDQAGGRDE